jgi:hypothetical protein
LKKLPFDKKYRKPNPSTRRPITLIDRTTARVVDPFLPFDVGAAVTLFVGTFVTFVIVVSGSAVSVSSSSVSSVVDILLVTDGLAVVERQAFSALHELMSQISSLQMKSKLKQ